MMKEKQSPFVNTLQMIESTLYVQTARLAQFDTAFEMGYLSKSNPKDVAEYDKIVHKIANLAVIARVDICLN